MDGVFEKFSVFDFFNLIIGGILFVLGLGVSLFSNKTSVYLLKLINLPVDYLILEIIILTGVSFALGTVMAEMQYLVFENKLKWEAKLVSKCLTDLSVIGNEKKFEIYKKKAICYFEQEGDKNCSGEFTEEECLAFFAHCVYYIQIRNQHQKPERLRDVTGLAGILAIVFLGLVISDIFISIIYLLFEYHILMQMILLLLYSICAGTSIFRYKRALKNRIRMVMAIYDVSVEKGLSEGNIIY